MAEEASSIPSAPSASPVQPTVILTIGMAGSGKTTFMQVITDKGHHRKFFILLRLALEC